MFPGGGGGGEGGERARERESESECVRARREERGKEIISTCLKTEHFACTSCLGGLIRSSTPLTTGHDPPTLMPQATYIGYYGKGVWA